MVQCVLSHHTVLSRETEGNQKNRFTYVYNRNGLWFGSQNNVPAVYLTIMAATQDAGSMESLTSLFNISPTGLSLCTAFMAHSGRSAHKAVPVHCLHGS
jgi:hypothetical protein